MKKCEVICKRCQNAEILTISEIRTKYPFLQNLRKQNAYHSDVYGPIDDKILSDLGNLV